MEKKKDLTKELLANCFKELMLKKPFDKITIKMITDRAGLIRPTFYKHFQDKYEVLEWIFETEVFEQARLLIESGMVSDAVTILCKGIEHDRTFYCRALPITGPNSFYKILERHVYNAFLTISKRYSIKTDTSNPMLSNERIAGFYTHSLVHIIYDWLGENIDCSAEELSEAYRYLLSHSVLDIVS